MDKNFTEKIRAWLETPDDKKDYTEGAFMLLQLSGNKIMYNNLSTNPKGKADYIIYNIQKYYNYRVQELTHEDVKKMQVQVDAIIEKTISHTKSNSLSEYKKGKREDHDSLPDEIKQLYVDNLAILQKMRDLHAQLKVLSTQNATCPDSERFPFLKELISLDKQRLKNWETYDHFRVGGEMINEVSSSDESVKALRYVNLQKARYAKNHNEALKEKIIAQYKLIIDPSEKLSNELKELGIL